MRKFYIVFIFLILPSILKAQKLPYVNQTDIGFLLGNNNILSFSGQSFNGVVIDKWKIHLGLIVGVDVYEPLTVIPLAPSIKFLPFDSKKTNTYLSLTAGYAFSGLNRFIDDRNEKGGILFNPSFGIRLKSQRKAAFNINAGYKIQKSRIETFSNSLISPDPRFKDIEIDEYTFRRISLTLGISF